MLKQWQNPYAPYQVVIQFQWRTFFETVHIGCETRSDVARAYWQLRQARKAAARAPRHSVPQFPRFGYRWLRCRWIVVSYSRYIKEKGIYVEGKTHMLPPARLERPLWYYGREFKPHSIFDLIL